MARRGRRRGARADSGGGEDARVPMQPVDKPILSSPYVEPGEYWTYNPDTGEASRAPGRRPAGYWFRDERSERESQGRFFAEENFEDLPFVNALREDVRRWRESGYRNATKVTRALLKHWRRADKPRRLFFCQIEAAETIIYLAEIRMGGKRTVFAPRFADGDMPLLSDEALTRLGCKMATGSGKTVVMAMLTAWAFCNRGQQPSDARFPSAALVVCPNLTIRERLQVLRPEHPQNYYAEFDIVPTELRHFLQKGKVLVTNWHRFAPESEQAEGGRTYGVVNKGEEGADAFARRVLGDLHGRGEIMVLNDEGHHAYRPAQSDMKGLSADARRDARSENDAATVWVQGLDKIADACGIRFCADLSATPFYIAGSGHPEGRPFPWLVSDFSLVDAIESGIVKIPRLPVDDTTGQPEPRYFRLWKTITDDLRPGERLPGRGRKPKPDAVWEKAESALLTLAGQYKERWEYIRDGSPGQEKTPPVMIVVCDNTDIAEVFHRNISGEREVEVEDDDAAAAKKGGARRKRGKRATRTVFEDGEVFPELFSNTAGERRTLRIDSKILADAESGKASADGESLRRIVDSVGKPGQPGERVRCVVSVQMLTEGWDANNVTHILGLRAFESQLLCEQVVGRGLRRMDYTPDPDTGMLTEEYVDVYGIPFSVIPYKGRPRGAAAPIDKPKHHVRAMPERAEMEMRFPVVEGFAFALKRDLIKADVPAMGRMGIEPSQDPTAVYVKAKVGYELGDPSRQGPGDAEYHDRAAFYAATHLQRVKFEIARGVVDALLGNGDPDLETDGRKLEGITASRHRLFPQAYAIADEFVDTRIDFGNEDPRELGLQTYMSRAMSRLLDAIQPNDAEGETPLLPILNRYKPIGTTADVDFKTIRRVHATTKSHLNQTVLDTQTWESAAAFRLEESPHVEFYARNDHLGLAIGYEYDDGSHWYEPDFLVRLTNGLTLILETKGYEPDRDDAKREAANRWVSAVNNWGKMGEWAFHVCRDPQRLGADLQRFAR